MAGTYREPYGRGDILYVRETWAFLPCVECMDEGPSCNINPAVYDDGDCESEGCFIYKASHPRTERVRWTPSIHMPKAAARIYLKVTSVRAERLQEITEAQAEAEGARKCYEVVRPDEQGPVIYISVDGGGYFQTGFKAVWNTTIPTGKRSLYGWDANPWVWAIEFERCEKPEPCILAGVEPAEDKRPCIGYGRPENGYEPCEMCKACRSRNGYEGG